LPAGQRLLIWFTCLSVLLLIFAGAQLNPVGYLLAGLLTPLPVLLAGERLGDWAALLLGLAAVAFMLALKPGFNLLWENLGFLSLLLMGLLLSFGQHRGLSAPGAILVTVVALAVLTLLVLVGQAVYQGVGIQALAVQKSTELLATLRQMVGEKGAAGGSLIPGVPPAQAESMLRRMLPGLLVSNAGLVAWLNVVLVRHLLLVLTGHRPEPLLYHWVLPEWLIFGLVGAGFLLFIPVAAVRLLSINLLLILGVLYFAQGVAVVAAWLNRYGLPRLLRGLGYVLIFLTPLLFFVIITLGVLDIWLDFRRLHRQPGDAGGGIQS
jgi:uncharacterized protein YybS (DUF2232 family)